MTSTTITPPADLVPVGQGRPIRYRPRHVSASSLNEWLECQVRWAETRLYGEKEPPTVPQVRGTFVHRVLELLFSEPPAERTVAKAKALAHEVYYGQKELPCDREWQALALDDEQAREFRQTSWALVANRLSMGDPTTVDVVSTEQQFRTVWGSAPVSGKIDRVERDPDGQLVVVDEKTGKVPNRRYDNNFEDYERQIRFYAGVLTAEGTPVDRGRLSYPAGQYLRNVDVRSRLLDDVQAVTERAWEDMNTAIDTDRYRPNPKELCGWCPLITSCPTGETWFRAWWWHRRKAQVEAGIRAVPPAAITLGLWPDPLAQTPHTPAA